ncbi:MAG: hypothetical protein JWO48_2182 [Bryobacterales bacterium]|nr:hypothetical protein [Bryobacterales bacterium]
MPSSTPQNISSSDKVNWLAGCEVFLVFSLIMVYIWWLRFRYPYSWIAIFAVVIASHLYHRETFAKLGFQWTGMRRTFVELSIPLGALALALLALGIVFRTVRDVTWQSAILSFALYCAWGLFQQYLLNGYFVNRIDDFLAGRKHAVPVLAAVFFSLAHLPNWLLMLVTLAGGYVCARIFLKHRNLYFLGVAHGVVGFLIYLVVPDTISHHLYVGPKWFSM